MLAIRMQRTGRKGHAMFRLVVQDSRRTPTSGKVVARLGNYDPHVKGLIIDKEKATFYLGHGAQPSDRVARLLKADGVDLPKWVKISSDKKRDVRTPEKRRNTNPALPETPGDESANEGEPSVTTPEASEDSPVEETTAEKQEIEQPSAAQDKTDEKVDE